MMLILCMSAGSLIRHSTGDDTSVTDNIDGTNAATGSNYLHGYAITSGRFRTKNRLGTI